jgi:hypothetical protein
MKPEKLKVVTLLLCLFNLYGVIELFFLNTGSESFRYVAAAAVIVVMLSYLVIAFFWQGKNWARLLVMAAALISIPNIYNFERFHIVSKFVIGGEFVFALFLLYWLNTKKIKDYFSK